MWLTISLIKLRWQKKNVTCFFEIEYCGLGKRWKIFHYLSTLSLFLFRFNRSKFIQKTTTFLSLYVMPTYLSKHWQEIMGRVTTLSIFKRDVWVFDLKSCGLSIIRLNSMLILSEPGRNIPKFCDFCST